MAIDWNQFQKDVDIAVAASSAHTDAELAGKISSITRLTDAEVQEMFPDPGDAKKVAKLMEIVRKAGERNQKINDIVANIESFGGIVLKLLEKFA